MRKILFLIIALCIAQSSRAQSVDSLQAMPKARHLIDAFGVRIGLGGNQFSPGVEPILDPYYEVPFSNTLLSLELFIAYENFSAFTRTVYTGSGPATLASYGVHGNLRWLTNPDGDRHYFAGVGAGLDVYQTRVSASMPILFGELIDIGKTTQLDIAARATPLLYLGKGPGFYYGIDAGFRFPNFSN
jgi:hypothetical protein